MPQSIFLDAVRDQSETSAEIYDSAREADHRIANNLALIASSVRLQAGNISKQTSGFTNEEVGLLLAEIAGSIDAVGRLHKLLSREPEGSVDIGEHLAKMCATLKPFISSAGPVELFCDSAPGCVAQPNQIMPIALIVTEVVMNAIKYAHPAGVPGRIDVGCHQEDGRIVVEVCDNGVGLPETFNVERDGSLGFRVMRTLAAQLG
ncbi:MAG TPA: sensor histidine kinase, partial [Micropepsaceae bacterium]|nr:sensor histidine kinase [Micropepsaceae bacterium]